MLDKNGILMEAKPFSVGARIEHLQKTTDIAQFGAESQKLKLPPADYKLAVHLKNGRGVYTFVCVRVALLLPPQVRKTAL